MADTPPDNLSIQKYDVVIVGAGPGGIAAAVTASHQGARVLLLDDNFTPGGQIWRGQQAHPPTRQARHWFTALAQAKIERLSGGRVFAAPGPHQLLLEPPPPSAPSTAHQPPAARLIHYDRLILATGARELFIPFPGWTTPGVMGAGGLQAMVKAGLNIRGKRIIVAGSGPLLLAVAAQLRKAGATVPLIAEQTAGKKLRGFALRLAGSPAKLFQAAALRASLLGTQYATDSWPTAVRPAGQQLDIDLIINGRSRQETCDYLACGFGLVPNIELATELGCALTADQFLQVDNRQTTSIPHIYAVGEVTGIGGIEKALLEGQIAGYIAANQTARADALAATRTKIVAFSRALEDTFAPRPELFALATDDTIICRCEDVPLSALRHRLSPRDAKLQTRCGMGPCQSRICGPTIRRLLPSLPTAATQVRPPLFPVPLVNLAESQPLESHQTAH